MLVHCARQKNGKTFCFSSVLASQLSMAVTPKNIASPKMDRKTIAMLLNRVVAFRLNRVKKPGPKPCSHGEQKLNTKKLKDPRWHAIQKTLFSFTRVLLRLCEQLKR